MTPVIRTLIVDDEPVARRVLREELEDMAGIELVGEAGSGEDALDAIAACRPDLVLLDLRMPGMSGFEVVRSLPASPPPPLIVIVTAYDQHALEAFESGAVDYLLKPVSRARLGQAVERARARRGGAGPPPPAPTRKLVGRVGAEYFLLPLGEVLALQASGPQVWIYTARRKYLASESLRKLETRLWEANFQRIYRNTLINFDHVAKLSAVSNRRWLVTLSNQQEFLISKRLTPRLRALLKT